MSVRRNWKSRIPPPAVFQINLTTGDRTDAVLQKATNLVNSVWTDVQTFDPGFPQSVILNGTLPQQFFRVVAH